MAAEPCKGCVCVGCENSEKNGNVYGCKEKRCKACGPEKGYFKLMTCKGVLPVKEGGEPFRL